MSDDIHDKEQENAGPTVEPELSNKELKQYDYKNLGEAVKMEPSKVDNTNEELGARASLQKRAWDFVHQHRPELTRELNKKNPNTAPQAPGNAPAKDRHRGVVTDPDNDLRLKENKEKHDKEDTDQDTHDSILAQKDKAEKERKMRELAQINDRARTASINLEAANDGSSFVRKVEDPNKTMNPNVPPHIDRKTPHVPGVKPGPEQQEAGLRAHPDHGPMVNRLLGPEKATPAKMQGVYRALHKASVEENMLRNDPHYGTMVCGILGDNAPTAEKLNLIRERLHKALQNSSDLKVKNAINTGISLTANIMLNMGLMKDAK